MEKRALCRVFFWLLPAAWRVCFWRPASSCFVPSACVLFLFCKRFFRSVTFFVGTTQIKYKKVGRGRWGERGCRAGPALGRPRRGVFWSPLLSLSLSLSPNPLIQSHRERARAALAPVQHFEGDGLDLGVGEKRECVSRVESFLFSIHTFPPFFPPTHRHVVLDRERQRLHGGGRVKAALGRVQRQLAGAGGAGGEGKERRAVS